MRELWFMLRTLLLLPMNLLKGNRVSFLSRVCTNVCMNKSKVGRYTYIGRNSVLNRVSIGNYCSIAPGVQIGGMEHSYWWYSTSPRLSNHCVDDKVTAIGNDVWISAGVVIRQGVTISDGAVIGALSFVNEDVPENTICFGIPARARSKRLPEDIFSKLAASKYWDFPAGKAKRLLRGMEDQ
jgi:acetyltransferase-like isoleucine patch superfamily enzyme